MITYDQALDYIYNLTKFGIKLGLNNIRGLMDSLGNPHTKLKVIHVGGTNGKGSTASIISMILQKEGYKVGLFTSPHLVEFTERIKINNRQISKEKLCNLVEKIKPHVRLTEERANCQHPTFFEVITAMAFLYFFEEKVDFLILEVGLGGRLDATNICNPLISVITHLDFDHMDKLGNTIREIAIEKAGIIKRDGLVINARQFTEATLAIEEVSEKKNAKIFSLEKDFRYNIKNNDLNGLVLDYYGINEDYQDIQTILLGKHQAENVSLAITAVQALTYRGINVSEEAIKKGLAESRWEGRLEIIRKAPTILMDGAHNPSGIEVVKNAINDIFKYNKLILLLAIFSDKDYKKMIKIIAPLSDFIILSMAKSPRATDSELLFRETIKLKCKNNILIENDISHAIELAINKAEKEDLICITGSLHTVGEAKEYFQEKGKK